MAHEAAGYFCLQIHNPDVDTQYLESCPNIYSEVNLNAVSVNTKCLNVGSNIDILLQTVGRIFQCAYVLFSKIMKAVKAGVWKEFEISQMKSAGVKQITTSLNLA